MDQRTIERIQSFNVPGRLPSLNQVINSNRSNFYVGAKLKKRTDKRVSVSILESNLQPVNDYPIVVQIIYYVPNRRSDPDNILSSKKFIMDALQSNDIIENDGHKQILAYMERWELDKDNPRIEVRITEGVSDLASLAHDFWSN